MQKEQENSNKVKMSFWVRLATILRKLTCIPGLAERQQRVDPESHVVTASKGCKTEQESSHYVASERDGKLCGVPVRVTRTEGASGDNKSDKLSFAEEKGKGKGRPVHKAIELFDKPNDIETSLPRYQNKAPILAKKRSPEDEKKRLPDKMEKLKEQLQQKLAARLEKCKSERDFRVRTVEDVKHRAALKTESEDNRKFMSEAEFKTQKAWKAENGGTENALENLDSKDQKSEKEKQNCLLKVNLSQLNKSDPFTRGSQFLKSNTTTKTGKSFELSERKCFKPLVEMNYLNKLAKKDEKAGVEYGGGWDCHRCGERVYHAERMLACGNAYHKTCFSCVSCRKLLGPRTYLEAEMEIHCSQCHAKKFGLTGYGYGLGPGVLRTSP